jgi:hypothetical protein
LDQVADLCNHKVGSFDDLSMGDYHWVLADSAMWDQLGWPLDRATFVERLDEIQSGP